MDAWWSLVAPQPFFESQRLFYFQLQRTVDQQIGRVLEALRTTKAYQNTIVIFSSDHGEMLGSHGGMHEKWHNAYEETTHVPFIVSGPMLRGGRTVNCPTSHMDLIPTMLGLAGIDPAAALKQISLDHKEARPLVGRDLSGIILETAQPPVGEPVLFITEDEISEGPDKPGSPFMKYALWAKKFEVIAQPNHVESIVVDADVDGASHRIKFTRYHDNQQFWTVPGVGDERLKRKETIVATEPSPDEFELYDLTLDPTEQRNLAHPSHADDRSTAAGTHAQTPRGTEFRPNVSCLHRVLCPAIGRPSPREYRAALESICAAHFQCHRSMCTKILLAATSLIELGAGAGLLAVPGLLTPVLVGGSLDSPTALVVARLAGGGLFSLGIACGFARRDAYSTAARGLVFAMLFYNVAVAALLLAARFGLGLTGLALLPAAILHAAMTVWCIVCLLPKRPTP